MFKSSFLGLLPLLLLVLSSERLPAGQCVNLEKWDQLVREDFIRLDHEVSEYFYDNYTVLDKRTVSYDEQLLQSIRSIRHTSICNHFEMIYSDDKVMRDSAGAQVNLKKCINQLEVLQKFAHQAATSRQSVPLSALNMLEASARSESGVLNGNFNWMGSFASCAHALIAHDQIEAHFGPLPANGNSSQDDIKGRYCYVHLRAKSWPKDDPYFGKRLSLKSTVCIPEVCHSVSYADSQEVRDTVESLTKSNMIAPFNSDQYEVSYLYCHPDDDSVYREWNLGAKMFIVFIVVWSMLLLYANLKYQRRLRAMKRLGESIDIKMIVEPENQAQVAQGSDGTPKRSTKDGMQNLGLPSGKAAADAITTSNDEDSTPEPSDVDEEFADDIKEARRVFLGKQAATKRRFDTDRNPESLGHLDFVKAFSIKANIDFLFRRADFLKSKSQQQSNSTISQTTIRKVSQQQSPASPSSRKLSASNAALIKDLEKDSTGGGKQLAREKNQAASPLRETNQQAADQSRPKRVNIDVLDGIKVFATAYIVYGHTIMFAFGVMTDVRFHNERMLDFTLISTINALQVVGLFYIITGILIGYLAFSRQKVKQLLQPGFWLIVIIGRYLRLLPSYLLVFWFAKNVAPFLSSGPFWMEYRTDDQHPRGFCSNESWMTMLTMSSADVKIPYDCIPQTWYLSNDFRTLFIIPFYMIILALNATAGYAAIFSTLLYSAYSLTQILREADIDYKILLNWQPHIYSILTDRLHDVYTTLSIRLSTYLLGIIVGHLLHLYETGQIKRIPKWFKRFGLKAALIIGSGSFLFAPLLAQPALHAYLPASESVDSDTMVMMIPFLKTTMELCMCVTLFALITGSGFKWLNELFASQPARVLSNISYGVFLVHVEVMYKTPLIKYETNYYYLFLYSSFFILMSNVIAFFMHVLYEMPINNVLRHVFKKIFFSVVKQDQ